MEQYMHQPGRLLQLQAVAGCRSCRLWQDAGAAAYTSDHSGTHQYSLVLSGTRAALTFPVRGMVQGTLGRG
jgi:hypothetical protein